MPYRSIFIWLLLIAGTLSSLVCCPNSGFSQSDSLAEARQLNEQGVTLFHQGRYAEAEPLYKRSLAIREKTLGPDHPDVAQSLNNLALLYQAQGRLAEAEPLFKRSLATWEKALGPEHPTVALCLNNIAALYRVQGRYAEAEPLSKRALAIRERALSPDHPDVAVALNNLALLYEAQGRYAEAEPLFKRALAIREKALGPDHPDVTQSLNNLAWLYWTQSRLAEAEPLYKRALAIREKALGSGHVDVADSLNKLALLYQDEGRYSEAEPLFKRALAIREKVLRSEHPLVAQILSNLATLYRDQGRFAEAEPLYKRALAIQEKALGPDHVDVADSLNKMALLYWTQGRLAEAEPLYKRALAIREKSRGPNNPEVAQSLNNLALLYRDQGRYAEAEPIYKRSLAIWEKARGPDHPDVATSLNNLALLYQAQGRYAEAERLFKRSLAIMEKALGPEHPTVALCLNNLGALYRVQRRYAEAEPLFKRSLAIMEKALGPEHPRVALSLNNLALLYQAQGRYAEAEPIYKRSLAIREKALGSDRPDVAQSLNSLATLYQAQGRYTDAEPLFKRSVAIREKALGPDHPTVAESLDHLAEVDRAEGQIDTAWDYSHRAVDVIGKHLATEAGARSESNLTEQLSYRDYFLLNVALADAMGAKAPQQRPAMVAESFRAAQLAESSGSARAIAGMAARFGAGSNALAAVVRERQDAAERWRALDAAIVKASSEPSTQRDAAAEAKLRNDLDATEHHLDELDARIARDFPKYAELSNPQPLTVEVAQGLLGTDEALLVYLVGPDETWLWVVRPQEAKLHRIAMGAKALATEVKALRERLDPEKNPDGRPFPAARAYALYQNIFAPATELIQGVHHVLIVPDEALESLPFEVLVTKPPAHHPESPADDRTIAWLARDYATTVLPGVSSLRALREFAANGEPPLPFLGVGNPVLKGSLKGEGGARGTIKLASLFRGALADVNLLRMLPPLPETATEIRQIAKILGAAESDLYLGERASEPLLRRAKLDRYRVVEFATHSLVSGQIEGLAEPALVLTPPPVATADNDGLLTASKIATLKLDADWIVLSACNTAAGDGTPDAGGLSGLAKAFFYAGSRAVLVSHWPVASEAAVRLTTGAFAALAKDPSIGRAEALRRSEMALLDDKSLPAVFAHPMAWAPFVVVGEGWARR